MSITFPQTVFDANTIAKSIHDNWSLSGLLALAENVDSNTTNEGIYMFAHQNPEGIGRRIVVLVRKVTPRENVIEHPKFDEVRDVYECWTHYILENIDEQNWINAESLVQQIQDEVLRILKLLFDPAKNVGIFFSTDRKWDNKDDFTQQSPQINRVLTFALIRLRSRDATVPVGYGFILAFNVVSSDGSGLPSSNYIFTEAYHVDSEEGWDTVEEVVSGMPPSVLPQGAPIQFTAKFTGFFECQLYPKLVDIDTSTNMLNQIWQLLSVNHVVGGIVSEIPRIYLIITTQNLNNPTNTLTDNMVVRPIRFKRIYDQEELVGIRLQAKIYKPSNLTFI
jgi:hypothetical protein